MRSERELPLMLTPLTRDDIDIIAELSIAGLIFDNQQDSEISTLDVPKLAVRFMNSLGPKFYSIDEFQGKLKDMGIQ